MHAPGVEGCSSEQAGGHSALICTTATPPPLPPDDLDQDNGTHPAFVGAHRALCPRCAKSRLFGTRLPQQPREHSNYCVAMHKTTQIPALSKKLR